MKDVFIISNQHGQFLGKQGQWLDESEPTAAWRSPHRDVALNYLIENNSRDIEQRLVLLQCPLNEKDIPLLGDAEPARKSAPVTFDEPEATVTPDNAEDDADRDIGIDSDIAVDSDSVDGEDVHTDIVLTDSVLTENTGSDEMDIARD